MLRLRALVGRSGVCSALASRSPSNSLAIRTLTQSLSDAPRSLKQNADEAGRAASITPETKPTAGTINRPNSMPHAQHGIRGFFAEVSFNLENESVKGNFDAVVNIISNAREGSLSFEALTHAWLCFAKHLGIAESSRAMNIGRSNGLSEAAKSKLISKLIRLTLPALDSSEANQANPHVLTRVLYGMACLDAVSIDPAAHDIIAKIFSHGRNASRTWVQFLCDPRRDSVSIGNIKSCARLSRSTDIVPLPKIVHSCASFVISKRLNELTVSRIAALAYALAWTKRDPAIDNRPLIQALAIEAEKRAAVNESVLKQLTVMPWAMGVSDVQVDGLLKQLVSHLIKTKFNGVAKRDLASMFLGFNRLNQTPSWWDPKLLDVLADVIVEQGGFSQFSTSSMSALVSSLARLSRTNPRTSRIISAAAEELLQRDLSRCSTSVLSNLAWAFGSAGVRDRAAFNHLTRELARRDLNEFSISLAILGYAKAGIVDEALFHKVAVTLMTQDFTKYSSQTLALITYAYGTVGMFIQPMVCKVVDEINRRGLTSFTDQGLSLVLGGMAKMKYLDRNFVERLLSEVRTRQMDSFQDSGRFARNTIMALAEFNLADDELVLQCARAGKRCMHTWSAQSIVNVAWAFACLGQLHQPAVKEFFQMNLPTTIKFELVPEVPVQIYHTKLAWQYAHPGETTLPLLLRQLVGNEEWVEEMILKTYDSSQSHLDVSNAIRRLGYNNVIDEYRTPAGLVVDIAVSIPGKEKMHLIEVDGPHHFLTDGVTPTGATTFKRRLLQAEGFSISSINVSLTWRYLSSPADQEVFLKELLLGSKTG